jgi:vacuolar-type H+-ATPase subunit H
MIDELLLAVKEAEEHAEKIIAAAHEAATHLAQETSAAIEKINEEAEAKILLIQAEIAESKQAEAERPIKLAVDKNKITVAENHIIAEFNKRFK